MFSLRQVCLPHLWQFHLPLENLCTVLLDVLNNGVTVLHWYKDKTICVFYVPDPDPVKESWHLGVILSVVGRVVIAIQLPVERRI